MSEWFENESFWKETYNFLFSEKLFKETNEQVENVLKLVDFHGSAVLDLCCGPGRCSIVLAKKGFSVTGVDRSPFLLDKAKERAKSEGLSVEWVLEDMRRFIRPESYDLVLNMFTSFGYFDDKQDDMNVLENVLTNLKPGGIFLIDVMAKEILAKIFQPTISNMLEDGTMVVQRPEIFDDWTRVKNDWIIIKGSQAKTFKFHHTIYSGQELKDRMEQVGFESVKLYGNLDGSPYDSNAQRLIITGLKPPKKVT
jgi:SAM-dependent methyltransferase